MKCKNIRLYNALLFRQSATVLDDAFDYRVMPITLGPEIRFPAMVLSAFACEMFIKGMLKSEKLSQIIDGGKGHSLKALFYTLKGKTQNSIINKVSEKTNAYEKEKQEAIFQEAITSVKGNNASTPEQREAMINQLTEMHKKAMDKNATVTVVEQNKEKASIAEMLANMQRIVDKDENINKCICELLRKLEELPSTIQVTRRAWFGEPEFHKELKKHSNAFVDWRYSYETGAKSFYPRFMNLFQESMLEFCQENNIFDMDAPDF